MAKNAYAKQLQEKKKMEYEIVQRWTAQLCLDVMTIVLNDPKVMGHDRFGPQRLQPLGEAFNAEYKTWIDGLSSKDNASYVREKMDERLKKIWGDGFEEWKERYYLWNDKGI